MDMDRSRHFSRRTFLEYVGITAGALLAGCNTPSDGTPDTPSTSTATKSPSETKEIGTPTDAEKSRPTESSTETDTPPASELAGGTGPLPEKVWPLPHRGISHGAYLPDGPLFESEPVVDWQIVPKTPSDRPFTPNFTTPVIADGRLYTVKKHRFGANQASPDEHFLRAYDTSTGDERWEFTIPQGSGRSLPTRPAIGDEVVLVGRGQRLHAVGMAEGSEAWSQEFDKVIDAVYPMQDRTYVKAGWSLVTLNANTDRAWTKEFDAFPEILAQGPDNLYVAASRRLLALDPTTGNVRWQQTLPTVEGGYAIKRLITVAAGVFALQASGDLYAFSNTGRQVWHADDQYRSLSTDGSRVYARTMSEGMLRALAVPTGKPVWEVRCQDLPECESEGSFHKPVLTDTALYTSYSSGRVVAVRPTDGTIIWTVAGPTDFAHLSLGSDAIYGVGFGMDPLVKLRAAET